MISARSNLEHILPPIIVGTPIAVLVGALVAIIGGQTPFLFYFVLFYFALIIIAPIIFVNYRIGVWLLVFLLPFLDTQLVPRNVFGITGFNPINILLMLTLSPLFVSFLSWRGAITLVHLPRPFLAYIAVIAFAAYVGAGSAEHAIIIPADLEPPADVEPPTVAKYLLENFAKPMILLIVAWLAATVARNGNGRPLIWALAAAYVAFFLVIVGYIAIYGISLESLASPEARGFISWTGLHANQVGLLANMGLAILLFTAAATSRPLPRLFLFACAAAAATVAALTFSRGAFIGFAIILGYYLLTRRRINQFLLMLSVIVSVSWILPNAFVERATTGLQTSDEYAITAGRLDIWRPLLPTFWEAPIVGHGLASTPWATPNLRGELQIGQPHSAYLGVLLDLGLVGIAVVGAFFWSAWRTFRRLSQDHVDSQWRGVFEGGIVSLMCLAVQGLTDDQFVPTYPQAALWVCYGLALGHTQSTHLRERCPASSWTPRSALSAVSTHGSAGPPHKVTPQPDGQRRITRRSDRRSVRLRSPLDRSWGQHQRP